MEKIKLQVSGNAIAVTERPEIITSGTIGLPVEFTFDDSWEGLNRLAVFRAGDVAITAAEPGVVPWEVLEKPNVWLQIGVYGVNADGTVAIPTMWASVCVIHTGVNPDGEVSADPTLTVWQRVMDYMDKLQADTAPAGWGIGKLVNYAVADDAAVDSVLINEINSMGEHNFKRIVLSFKSTNNFTGGGGHYYTDIYKLSTNYAMITIKSYIHGGREMQRVWFEGELKPWEWVNPPMQPGVEYRTTQRWNGRVLYTKLFDCGTIVDGKIVVFDDVVETCVVRYGGTVSSEPFDADIATLPHSCIQVDIENNGGALRISCPDCDKDDCLEGYYLCLQLWYYKY